MPNETEENFEQEYADLIERVAVINQEAADYLRDEAIHNDGFLYDGDLAACFRWKNSPKELCFGQIFIPN
jgi:hypothetical protein